MRNGPTPSAEAVGSIGDEAIGRLRLTRSQYGLLTVLIGFVALIAVVGYRSNQEVNEQTENLNRHLQTVSGDRVSLERQVLTFALEVERWSNDGGETADLDVSIALVERQRRVALDEASNDEVIAAAVDELTIAFNEVVATISTGRPVPGSEQDEQLTAALTSMVTAVKQLFDRTEGENFALLHDLEAGLGAARQTEFVVAGLIIFLVGLLVVSIQRMLGSNYRAASRLLRREQARYGAARADQAKAEHLSLAQTEILEMVARDTPMLDVLERTVSLMSPHLPGIRLRFATGPFPPDPDRTDALALSELDGSESIGSLEWTVDPTTELPADFEATIRLAGRLGSLTIDRQLAADRMVFQATHDALTGLPNRTLLVDRVSGAIERAGLHNSNIAVMFLDVDRFKVVNDSLGHEAGDGLLVQLADRLAGTIRTAETVARFGGDEFVVLLEDVEDMEQVQRAAQRILELLAEPVALDGTTAHVSASIGIVAGGPSSTVDELLKHADVAMYRAKHTGRNRYELFDQEMQEWAAQRHATESALRSALERDELEAFYQPVIDLHSMQIKGFESLVRWRRPGVGLVPPADFIALAEELGIIDRIGSQMLSKATGQLKEWRRANPELTMSVNVSGRELALPGFVNSVARILEESQTEPGSLVLEITESVLLDDAEAIGGRLSALRDLGVRVAIDDFGTGYSSLRYLRDLPVDILKIDRAFVSSGTNAQLHDPMIVASVTDLGHALGLEVVAEGIETAAQLDSLRALGVDSGQGYFFARPVAADEAELNVSECSLIEHDH